MRRQYRRSSISNNQFFGGGKGASFWCSVVWIVECYRFFVLWFLFESHSVSWVVVTGVGYGITWIQNLFSAYGFGVCLGVCLGVSSSGRVILCFLEPCYGGGIRDYLDPEPVLGMHVVSEYDFFQAGNFRAGNFRAGNSFCFL
jgi:hypothetical protein